MTTPTHDGDWHSVAVCSDGDYDIEPGLICSYPIRTAADGKWEVAKWVPIGDFSRAKIDASVAELKEEKVMVADLL